MISLGQWSDTKALITETYQAFVTHFTHQVQYEQLHKVQVGSNLAFVEQTFGMAKLIKSSRKLDHTEYRYYSDPKFVLAVATQGDRVAAYSVMSMDNTFFPELRFSHDHLGKVNFAQLDDFSGYFSTDAGNVIYYQEGSKLGKEGLFMNRYMAYVDYAAQYSEHSSNDVDSEITELNNLLVLEDDEQILQQVDTVRQSAYPNVVIFGDINEAVASDMLLTRNEYKAHFKD